jgi:ribosomal protein S18 acetylase RimI-like enzyme
VAHVNTTSPGPDITIDELDESGAGELLTLQRAAFVSEAQIYGSADMPPLTQTLEQVRAELREGDALGARREGRLVGAIRFRMDGETLLIGVAPDQQGEGVGRLLLEAAERRSGAGQAELFTGSLSEANIRLYESCGYAVSERVPDGDGTEQVFMRKRLRP